MRTTRTAAAVATLLCCTALVAACSSGDDAASMPASAIAAASSAAAAAGSADAAGAGGTPEMIALCDQMVADALTPEAATSLAESKGYTARVGTIDGQPQALTMDLRDDRFTFEVTGGVVVSCTYG